MRDVRLIETAGRQHNRISRAQLEALDYSDHAIQHRLDVGRLVVVEQGVFAVPPVLDDDFGAWMGATLTAPETYLSHVSAAAAGDFWPFERRFEIVTRPGNGGPRRYGNLLVCRSRTLEGETTMLGSIPITKPPRTLVDLAGAVSPKQLARAVRDAVRVKAVTIEEIADGLARHRGRRGCAKLARVLAGYSGLPIERARSGAEVRALVLLREHGRPMPRLNQRIASEEADLSWARHHLIIEIDGGPFHLDVGEDARKQTAWERAGWRVERISSDDVYDRPARLLDLAPPVERP